MINPPAPSEEGHKDATRKIIFISRANLKTKNIDEQLLTILANAHVLHFDSIKSMVTGYSSNNELIALLEHIATVVQGCWVLKSEIISEGRSRFARDFILCTLAKQDVVKRIYIIEKTRMHPDIITELISQLCVVHQGTDADSGWRFKIQKDEKFISEYPDVVKRQNKYWSEKESWVLANLKQPPIPEKPKNKSLIGSSSKDKEKEKEKEIPKEKVTPKEKEIPKEKQTSKKDSKKEVNKKELSKKELSKEKEAAKGSIVIDTEIDETDTFNAPDVPETMEIEPKQSEVSATPFPAGGDLNLEHNLIEFIDSLLKTQGVLNFNAIKQAVKIANTSSTNVPESIIQDILDKIAAKVNSVYMIKSTGDAELDKYRNMAASAFRTKEKVKKSELFNNEVMSTHNYNKIMNEFAAKPATGGRWGLKIGDLLTIPPETTSTSTTTTTTTTSTS